MDAKVEENYEAVALATADDASLDTRPLLCDPILDYLEIDLVIVPSHTSFPVTAKEDENYEYVKLATDESTLEAKPLKVDSVTSRLLIDLTFIP